MGEIKMRRLKRENTKTMINYWDEKRAQRWGKLEAIQKNSYVVSNVFKEKFVVPKDRVIKMEEVPENE